MRNRQPPADVLRELRREAGFGCAQCGSPILDYHHIIEWSEKEHHDPKHMIALCPTCHREIGKLPKDRAYQVKQNPINIRKKRFEGFLGGNSSRKALRIGSLYAEDCGSVIEYAGNEIFSYDFDGEQTLLSAFLPDSNFWPEIEIKQNNACVWIEGFWDIEFKTNWITFRRKKGEVYLTADFRDDIVCIKGVFDILGERFEFKPQELKIGTNTIGSLHVSGSKCAVRLGPKGRILKPNFAMLNPRALHVPE